MFDEATGVEEMEVATPSEEQAEDLGEEVQEVTEPVSEGEDAERHKNTPDEAFAEMRRARQKAEAELESARAELEELRELKAQSEARNKTIARLTGTDGGDIAALAELTGMSEDDIRAEMENAEESAQKDLRIEQLEAQLTNAEAEKLMQADLERIRKIDPSVKSLEELEGYADYVLAGLPPEKAYWAIKAEERANHIDPPKPMGKVAAGTAEKDYFTDEEIDAMSSDELTKNWKKIMATWDRKSR